MKSHGMTKYNIFLGVIVIILFQSCRDSAEEIPDMEVYEGPIRVGDNVDAYYSEAALKTIRMKAKKVFDYKNEDREFPEGLYIEFFEIDGTLSSTLQGNTAYYTKTDNLWKVNGDVVVKSHVKDQELKTEELFWSPDDERIYSEKFVIIKSEGATVKGTGFETNETFYPWKILKPVDSGFSF